MNKHILLGIDLNLSSRTQRALRLASGILARSSQDLSLVLLHVIPVLLDSTPTWGKTIGFYSSFTATLQERQQAERALQRARLALEECGIASQRIALLQRVGTPADEIVKVARELEVDCVMIGSHGNTFAQKLRRVVMGSTSRRVVRLAPCPIIVVAPPDNLIGWYREAVMRTLSLSARPLLIFTAGEVAELFAPPERTVGSQEVEAATHALEQLAAGGMLCGYEVGGEWRYVND